MKDRKNIEVLFWKVEKCRRNGEVGQIEALTHNFQSNCYLDLDSE